MFVRNLRTGQSFSNDLWREFGYGGVRLSDDFWQSIIHPDDRENTMRRYEDLLAGRSDSFRIAYRIKTASGEWRWIMNQGRVVAWDANGMPEIYIGADLDVTDRIRAEEDAAEKAQEAETLRMAGAIVASTLEIERTVQLVLDQALNVVPYDTATVELLQGDTLEVIGGSGWDDLSAVLGVRVPFPGENPHTRAVEERKAVVIGNMGDRYPSFSELAGHEIRSWLGVPLIVHGDVIGVLVLESATPEFFTPKHTRLVSALGDHVAVAIQNAQLFEQTRELAMTDSLTGVATRRNLFTQAEQILERAKRSGNPVSFVMTDLDHFKRINDTLGHARGDDAIQLAAKAATASLRKSDVIGRYGGEEFGIVLPATDAESALIIAERIRANVRAVRIPGTDATLSISVGVVTTEPGPEDTVDNLIDRADKALFEAKTEGRDRVASFVDTSHA